MALSIPLISILSTTRRNKVLLTILTLILSCLAASDTPHEATDAATTIQSLAATAYAQYIAAEVTEPDVRTSIIPIINGSKPDNTDNTLHGWTQNFRGSINNTFKWCGLVDCLIEETPDFAVLTETSSDNHATDLIFLHRQMYKEDPDNEDPPKIDENLPYTVFSTSTSTPGEKGGVVLLLHKKWQHRVVGKPTYDEHGRWLSVDIRTPKGRTTIIAAYLPPSPQDNATTRTAWAALQVYII